MIDTRKMTMTELFQATNKPIWELGEDGFKAARVLERRRKEWFKTNPSKSYEDWIKMVNPNYEADHLKFLKMMGY